MSVDVYIDIVLYIIPIIGGVYIREFILVLYISCQQLGDMCNFLGVFGPFGPRVGGLYLSSFLHCGPKVGGVVSKFMFKLVLYISCQQLGYMCNLLGVFGPFQIYF